MEKGKVLLTGEANSQSRLRTTLPKQVSLLAGYFHVVQVHTTHYRQTDIALTTLCRVTFHTNTVPRKLLLSKPIICLRT